MPDKDVLLLTETFPSPKRTTSSEIQAVGEAPVRYPVHGVANETRSVSPPHGAGRAILVGWLPSRQPHSSWVAVAFSEPPRWACCRALLEREIVPDLIVGSSVGALNGAFIAADPSTASVDRMVDLWTGLSDRGVFGGSVFGQLSTLGPPRDAPPRQRWAATIAQ